MKDELGIEICGENCKGDVIPNYDCPKCGQKKCGYDNCKYFSPKEKLLKQRIKELQEQQFTEAELQFIKNRLDECIEEWDVPDMVFIAHQILKKIEQTLKNLEGNLNNEQ